ncbi:hypothetical protein DdX_13792 [Ditylenchus destructor]|uniref:Uncharacterized protein n=1 Tax=Ditylenchus destructor TaxID=166010 RepID=A0AAD4MSA1_9BILA|nr:hypothetical protein DdX_13792 [Ditylenchus destructor]
MYGAIASILENNACDKFKCALEDMEYVLVGVKDIKEVLEKVFELWDTLFSQIAPNTFGLLYRNEQLDPNSALKRTVTAHFRDRVLVRLFRQFTPSSQMSASSEWRKLLSIFKTIDSETKDDSSLEYKTFERLFLRLSQIHPDSAENRSPTGAMYTRSQSKSVFFSPNESAQSSGYKSPTERKVKGILRRSPRSSSDLLTKNESISREEMSNDIISKACSIAENINDEEVAYKLGGIYYLRDRNKTLLQLLDYKPLEYKPTAVGKIRRRKNLHAQKSVHFEEKNSVHYF